MRLSRQILVLGVLAASFGPALSQGVPATRHQDAATALRPDQARFRAIFAQLVDTDTSYSTGNCTTAATQLAQHLWDAGFSRDLVRVITAPGHPREGNLVAQLPGRSPELGAILLMGHLDVVEAKREDWPRPPYALHEENGYFFGRGVADDKARVAIWVDSLIRYMQEGYQPRRTIKLALTCGEEGNGDVFNGAQWLAMNMPETLSATFALNEGGGGRLDSAGRRQALAMQIGEKATRTFDLEALNPGGHSSVPRPDNAIYDVSEAVLAVRNLNFPVRLNATTRAFLTQYRPVMPPVAQAAITDLLANEADPRAREVLARDPTIHAMLATSCVATMLEAGHAPNALPQRAKATINCRILPPISASQTDVAETIQAMLERQINNPNITVTLRTPHRPMAIPAPLDPDVLQPATRLAAEMFPNIPVIPIMLSGATDATMTSILGIPTYGVPGLFFDADGGGVHGLNERIAVASVYDGRDYLHQLVKLYTQ